MLGKPQATLRESLGNPQGTPKEPLGNPWVIIRESLRINGMWGKFVVDLRRILSKFKGNFQRELRAGEGGEGASELH